MTEIRKHSDAPKIAPANAARSVQAAQAEAPANAGLRRDELGKGEAPAAVAPAPDGSYDVSPDLRLLRKGLATNDAAQAMAGFVLAAQGPDVVEAIRLIAQPAGSFKPALDSGLGTLMGMATGPVADKVNKELEQAMRRVDGSGKEAKRIQALDRKLTPYVASGMDALGLSLAVACMNLKELAGKPILPDDAPEMQRARAIAAKVAPGVPVLVSQDDQQADVTAFPGAVVIPSCLLGADVPDAVVAFQVATARRQSEPGALREAVASAWLSMAEINWEGDAVNHDQRDAKRRLLAVGGATIAVASDRGRAALVEAGRQALGDVEAAGFKREDALAGLGKLRDGIDHVEGLPTNLEMAMILARGTAAKGTPTRDYALQEGDSLESIAAAQLGDRHRWVEIYDLNHEILDALGEGLVPAGSRIKLPAR